MISLIHIGLNWFAITYLNLNWKDSPKDYILQFFPLLEFVRTKYMGTPRLTKILHFELIKDWLSEVAWEYFSNDIYKKFERRAAWPVFPHFFLLLRFATVEDFVRILHPRKAPLISLFAGPGPKGHRYLKFRPFPVFFTENIKSLTVLWKNQP
jgi:hypothetical protein